MSSRAEAHDLTGDTPVDSTKSGGFDYSLVARRVEEQPLLVVGKVRFAKRKFGFGKLNSSHLEILSNVSVLDRARASAAVHASINDEDGQRLRLSIYERGGEAALNHSFGSISEVVMEEGGSSKGGAEVAVQQQAQDQESSADSEEGEGEGGKNDKEEGAVVEEGGPPEDGAELLEDTVQQQHKEERSADSEEGEKGKEGLGEGVVVEEGEASENGAESSLEEAEASENGAESSLEE
eukprot:gene25595-31283_t